MDQKWKLPHQHHVRKQAQTHHEHTQRTAYQQQNSLQNCPPAYITGHIGLNKHLYNMNITNTTKCPACDNTTKCPACDNTTESPACDYETETVTHFIVQCPAYSQIREDYFHTYHSNTDDIFNEQSRICSEDKKVPDTG